MVSCLVQVLLPPSLQSFFLSLTYFVHVWNTSHTITNLRSHSRSLHDGVLLATFYLFLITLKLLIYDLEINSVWYWASLGLSELALECHFRLLLHVVLTRWSVVLCGFEFLHVWFVNFCWHLFVFVVFLFQSFCCFFGLFFEGSDCVGLSAFCHLLSGVFINHLFFFNFAKLVLDLLPHILLILLRQFWIFNFFKRTFI